MKILTKDVKIYSSVFCFHRLADVKYEGEAKYVEYKPSSSYKSAGYPSPAYPRPTYQNPAYPSP